MTGGITSPRSSSRRSRRSSRTHARGHLFQSPGRSHLDARIVDFYRRRIDERTRDLGQVEKIKRFTLIATPFTQENGEITPTMKIRRKVIEKKYGDVIGAMYRDAERG